MDSIELAIFPALELSHQLLKVRVEMSSQELGSILELSQTLAERSEARDISEEHDCFEAVDVGRLDGFTDT